MGRRSTAARGLAVAAVLCAGAACAQIIGLEPYPSSGGSGGAAASTASAGAAASVGGAATGGGAGAS
ncbi:MAG TPA: hypothetical protein VHB21_04210, partial [Minicystis sp.]|nr:hypothetical protein [Minicystis sp.]